MEDVCWKRSETLIISNVFLTFFNIFVFQFYNLWKEKKIDNQIFGKPLEYEEVYFVRFVFDFDILKTLSFVSLITLRNKSQQSFLCGLASLFSCNKLALLAAVHERLFKFCKDVKFLFYSPASLFCCELRIW